MSDSLWENVAYLKRLATTEEERNKRKDICESCDKLTKMKTCQECGCFMPFKTWLADSNCSIGKW